MTQEIINTGASPNDTSGDPIRTAFTKVNNNFTDLYPQATPPTHSTGKSGDTAGMMAFDGTYIYFCTTSYTTGTVNIWVRMTYPAGTW
jgi:hypothetical protein